MRETGQPGVLTLKVKIAPVAKGADYVVAFSDDLSVKLRKAQTTDTIMYATDENGLQRTDPRQHEMKLHSVEGGQKPQTYQLKDPAIAAAR